MLWSRAFVEVAESNLKIIALLARILLGALFAFASLSYFLKMETPPPEGGMKTLSDAITATIYILPFAKVIELICSVAFLTNRFVPLAAILISPIILNIACIIWFFDRSMLPIAIFLIVANSLIAWHHREAYRPLLRTRA